MQPTPPADDTPAPRDADTDWFEPPDAYSGHVFDPDAEPIGYQLASEHQERKDPPEVGTEVASCG